MIPLCMATLIPANIDIPWEGLENGAIVNDDGHGFAIASKSLGLEVYKSMSYDLTALHLASARERHGADSIVLFHSRFATHGETNEFNVHPFYVGAGDGDVVTDTVMVHNGILPATWHPTLSDPRSDTRVFADSTGKLFTTKDDGIGVPSRRGGKLLGDMIGSGNKLVFLTVKGGMPKVRIINAHLGEFSGGVWYSNNGYCGWSGYSSRVISGGWRSDDGWGQNYISSSGTLKDFGSKGPSGQAWRDFCGYCQSNDLDHASSLCTQCEVCLDCKDWIGDCTCYLTAADKGAIDARVKAQFEGKQIAKWEPSPDYAQAGIEGKQIAKWEPSPLNPDYAQAGIEV